MYTFTISNNGVDTVLNTVATINIPQIVVNNITQYLTITSVTAPNTPVDRSQVSNGRILVNVGTLPVGQSITIQVKAQLPIGIDSALYSSTVTASGSDNLCG